MIKIGVLAFDDITLRRFTIDGKVCDERGIYIGTPEQLDRNPHRSRMPATATRCAATSTAPPRAPTRT